MSISDTASVREPSEAGEKSPYPTVLSVTKLK
jgi:hypothetical protein